jgi:hypothetical protein
MNPGHAEILHDFLDDELVRCAEEDEPDEDPDRRDGEGVDQSSSVADRHDVAVTHRGHGDHAEIQDVGK